MHVRELVSHTEKILRENSPVILTGLGVSGVITTGYLSARAAFDSAAELITISYMQGASQAPPLTKKQQIKLVWKKFIPAAVSGTVTIGCIVGATRIGSRRNAALTAAYSISERAFSEYREKVSEKFGKGKEQQVRDEIAQDHVTATGPSVIATEGKVWCCEMHTKRYFESDMETLRRAQNEVNSKMLRHVYATLDDFYYLVGLEFTSNSSLFGWDSDKLMELHFSTALMRDKIPCITFEYNYLKKV